MKARTNADTLAFNSLWVAENLAGRRFGARIIRRAREKLAARLRASVPSECEAEEIDRLDTLDLRRFERDYYSKGLPVVFSGAAKEWACVKNWSPQFFAERYGDRVVELGDNKYSDRGGVVESVPLCEAIPLLQKSSVRYVRFSSFLMENPELLQQIDPAFQRDTKRFMLTKGATQIFVGGAGTSTELHAAMTNNMFIQVHGDKDWILVHPSFSPILKPVCESSPTFRSDLTRAEVEQLPRLRTRLSAGDILYLPPFYWHHVVNASFSIGVAFRWLAMVPSFRTSALMAGLTAVATNPSPFSFLWDIKHGNSAPHFFRKVAGR